MYSQLDFSSASFQIRPPRAADISFHFISRFIVCLFVFILSQLALEHARNYYMTKIKIHEIPCVRFGYLPSCIEFSFSFN